MTLDTEAEIRFRLHKCLVKQEKYPEAVGVLESIKDRLRTPKIRAALARLHGAEERRTAALTQLPKNSSTSLDNYKLAHGFSFVRTVVEQQQIFFDLHAIIARELIQQPNEGDEQLDRNFSFSFLFGCLLKCC